MPGPMIISMISFELLSVVIHKEKAAGLFLHSLRNKGRQRNGTGVCKGVCQIVRHPFGYRSVHYLLALKPSKNLMVAELQVRTIFEEAWSEIDHHIRYPYQADNPILGNYLEIFNRLAGSADEMGSFIIRSFFLFVSAL